MTPTFTARDLDRIRRLNAVLLSPLEYPAIDAWRERVLDELCELTEASVVHFSIAPFEGVEKFRFRGYAPSTAEEYVRDWHFQDAAYPHLRSLGSGPYNHVRMNAVNDFGLRRYCSAVWNDWYRPNGFLDGAGAMLQEGGLFAQMGIQTPRRGDRRAGEVGYWRFAAVYPAMVAGARTLQLLSPDRGMLVRVLDEIDVPVAVFDRRARPVHLNRALRSVLAAHATGPTEADLYSIAGCHAAAGARNGAAPATISVAGYRVVVTQVQECLGLSEPAILLTLQRTAAPELTEVTARDRGLTPREAQVAVRVARGMRTREIAAELGISESTASHHIEHARARLGVRNRAALAAALRDATGLSGARE